MATPQALVEHALEITTADQCTVLVRTGTSANLRWANNTLTTNGVMSRTDVTVVSVVDGSGGRAAGVTTRTATTRAEVADLVAKSDTDARSAPAAEDAADLVTGAESSQWRQPPGSTSIDALAGFGRDLGEALAKARAEHRLLFGYAEHDVTTTYLGNSTGLRLRHEQPTGYVGITAKPADLSTSAWVGAAVENFEELAVPQLDAELATRLGWAERRVSLPADRYPTVLPPGAVADLMVYAYWVASARDAAEGQSVYSDPGGGTRVGQRLARPGVQLVSDPVAPGIGAVPFAAVTSSGSAASVFDNGLPLARTAWLTDGVLTGLATTRHSALLAGLANTPAIDNLILMVDDGDGSVADLAARMGDGLLLTCLWYIREVDPQSLLLTGLTRDGVYRVEGGEVTGVVNNFRFNESPISILDRFTDATVTARSFGREWGDYFPRTRTPGLLVPDFNMSSVSQAT